jgi:hypothetical protein
LAVSAIDTALRAFGPVQRYILLRAKQYGYLAERMKPHNCVWFVWRVHQHVAHGGLTVENGEQLLASVAA